MNINDEFCLSFIEADDGFNSLHNVLRAIETENGQYRQFIMYVSECCYV